MGSTPYCYTVPYENDYNTALQKLREREFEAGRYNPVVPFPDFPLDKDSESPGKKHSSIEAVFEDAKE
jgi:hypothetical protein